MGEDGFVAETLTRSRERRGDLQTRVVSGLVLAAVALGFNFAGSIPFALLVAAIALLMAWEWGLIARGTFAGNVLAAHAAAVIIAAVLAVAGFAGLGIALLCLAAIGMAVVRPGGEGRVSALGVLYVGVPAVALLWLRGDEPYGAMAILFILLVVWTADTAAFLSGRLIGGPKLWPSISPNKTWAGLLGGVAASGVAGALFSLALGGSAPHWLAFCGLAIGLVAVVGDLAESALKRGFGVKDASSLIPGHGGFLDRLDSIVSVAAAAGLFSLALDADAPARALLFGA